MNTLQLLKRIHNAVYGELAEEVEFDPESLPTTIELIKEISVDHRLAALQTAE